MKLLQRDNAVADVQHRDGRNYVKPIVANTGRNSAVQNYYQQREGEQREPPRGPARARRLRHWGVAGPLRFHA